MASTSPRAATRFGRFLRAIAVLSLGIMLLASVAGGAGATSLVAVQAHGGPHGAIAALASDNEIVMSRSVGLMTGASADPAAAALGREPIEVSRSIGLMTGARS